MHGSCAFPKGSGRDAGSGAGDFDDGLVGRRPRADRRAAMDHAPDFRAEERMASAPKLGAFIDVARERLWAQRVTPA